MENDSISWRILPVAWPIIVLSVAAEATSNALRAYGLGVHLEQYAIDISGISVSLAGTVLVAASVAISIAQAVAAKMALTGKEPQKRTATLALTLFLAVSTTAMISHIMEAQRVKGGDEATKRGAYDRALAEHDALARRIKALRRFGKGGKSLPRPDAVIQAQIAKLAANEMSPRRWRISKHCTDVTRQSTAEACAPITALFPERAAAAQYAKLSAKLSAAKQRLAGLHRPEAAAAQETIISGLWPWLMGFAVVFLATFGTVLFAVPETVAEETETVSETVALANVLRQALETPAPRPTPAKPLPRGGQMTKLEAEQWLTTHLAMGNSLPAQGDLVERFGRPKGTVSKWCKIWEEDGLIARSQIGRCKQLVAC